MVPDDRILELRTPGQRQVTRPSNMDIWHKEGKGNRKELVFGGRQIVLSHWADKFFITQSQRNTTARLYKELHSRGEMRGSDCRY